MHHPITVPPCHGVIVSQTISGAHHQTGFAITFPASIADTHAALADTSRFVAVTSAGYSSVSFCDQSD
jgi:hypothetical protein